MAVLLLICAYLIFSDIFQRSVSVLGNIPLGTDVNVNLAQQGAFATTITYDASNLPGAKVLQSIKISLPLNQSDAVVRARAFACDEGGNVSEIKVTVADIWIKEDNYYYYNEILKPGSVTNFCQRITLPKEEDFFNIDKYYEIIVIFETLPYDDSLNIYSIWQDVPTEWLKNA